MLPDLPTLMIFIAAVLVLVVTPGPAVLYIVAQSIDQGRIAGIVSVLGISVASLFHTAAAALGLSALLVSSALAYNVIKYLGAAYLIYLGLKTLLTDPKNSTAQTTINKPRQLSHIFYQGLVVNLLNPKAALFFFAFLPQFVDPQRGTIAGQIFILGFILITIGMLSDGFYAILAGSVAHWLRGNLRFLSIQRYLSGTIYILLGITTAFSGLSKD